MELQNNPLKLILPSIILSTLHKVIGKSGSVFKRDGVVLEKGAVITGNRIEKKRELYEKICAMWSVYPDLYLKMITPVTSKFKLKFFQIIFLRACLRHGRILTIAPRAAGKSFICILALFLICIFRPGSHVFQCAKLKVRRSIVKWKRKFALKLEHPKAVITTIFESLNMMVMKIETK